MFLWSFHLCRNYCNNKMFLLNLFNFHPLFVIPSITILRSLKSWGVDKVRFSEVFVCRNYCNKIFLLNLFNIFVTNFHSLRYLFFALLKIEGLIIYVSLKRNFCLCRNCNNNIFLLNLFNFYSSRRPLDIW